MSVYFFYGQEDFNIEREIEKLKKTLDKSFASMNFKAFDNPLYPDFIATLRSQPMMFGKMLIVIHIENYLTKTLADNELADIKSALESNSDNLDIVLVAALDKDGSGKIDSRKKLTKLLMKFNPKEFPIIKSYQTAEISKWIKTEAKSKKISINDDAINLLIEFLGTNLRQISMELDKLQLLAYPSGKVDKSMVKEICITSEDLFDFTNAIMTGQKDKALVEYSKLLDKKHPLEILAAFQTMLRKWILIKINAKTKSPTEIGSIVGMHEFVVKKNLESMKNTSLKDLVVLKENITEAEYRIKGGLSVDDLMEVQNAILR